MADKGQSALDKAMAIVMNENINPMAAPGTWPGIQEFFAQMVPNVSNEGLEAQRYPMPSYLQPGAEHATRTAEQYRDYTIAGPALNARHPVLKGVFQQGTDYVPETGIYMLHKGEKVVPADKNPANKDKSITVYKDNRSIQIDPKLYKAAKAKGWSRNKPTSGTSAPSTPAPGAPAPGTPAPGMPAPGATTPAAAQQSAPPTAQGGLGGGQPSVQEQMRTMTPLQAFTRGAAPWHSAPEGLYKRPGVMGALAAGAEDMLNLRELAALREQGNLKGYAGMAAGTLLPFAVSGVIKGMIGGARTLRGAEAASKAARAAERAAELQKGLGGSVKDSRIAADFTQPILDALSRQYDRLHKLLDKEVLQPNPKVGQLANQMKGATEPAIRRIGEDILQKIRATPAGQTLIDYASAHGLHNQIQRMLTKLDAYKIGQWEPILRELDKELEAGKEAVANAKGLGEEWRQLGELWKGTNNLAKGIVQRMSTESGIMSKFGPKIGLDKGLPKGAAEEGARLAKAAGISKTSLPKPGAGIARTALKGAQAAHPAVGAITGMTAEPTE